MRKGYSMLELMVVIGFIAIVAVVATLSLTGRRGTTEFDGAVKQMVAKLREAQSRSMSQASSTTWGVYFSNSTGTGPFFALFAGPSYSTSTLVSYHKLPSIVGFATSSIPAGGWKSVSFAQITGATVATSVMVISMNNVQTSSTISIATSGAVSY